jgi:type I restriction enzyme M protein
VLFVDARRLATLIPGSRKQKQLSVEEIERIAAVYREFRRKGKPATQPGFCTVATLDDIRSHRLALTAGRYVGSEDADDEDSPFEERYPQLVDVLRKEFAQAGALARTIDQQLARVGTK